MNRNPEHYRTTAAKADGGPSRNCTVEVGAAEQGQRIDNLLFKLLKGVPKSRIYRAIRSGEVRVNGSRVKADSRACLGDRVRVPPIRPESATGKSAIRPHWPDTIAVLYEDQELMVVNKPAGLAVHSGTGADFGLIDVLRVQHSSLDFVELAHRLDKDTSGCLMLAKSRKMLLHLHDQLGRQRTIGKRYKALVRGRLESRLDIRFPLLVKRRNPAGRKVIAHEEGDHAWSVVNPKARFDSVTLVDVDLHTGRMHQVRVHCAQAGYPIAGDRKYGDWQFNRSMRSAGLDRLFLHASSLEINLPPRSRPLRVSAPMPDSLSSVIGHCESGQMA